MIRVLLAVCVALSIASPAHAQIAAAIGKPLPSPDMPPGSVSVRVVAGSPSNPISGTEVTLVVNGTPRAARTDDAGRAFFKDLPTGAKVQAKVVDDEKQEHSSDEFELPSDTGVRLMLSTRPWNPAGGGGGPMMGGGAMPNPRQMSGQARPEQDDPPGQLTVRLTYDDFKDAPPVDVPVALVGYAANGSVTWHQARSDKEGRATFTGLDRTGATAYYAMAQLPRNGASDRLFSTGVMLDPRSGVRMILSAEKRTSTAPPVDDLGAFERQEGAPEAGKIRVTLEGAADSTMNVTLYDAESHVAIAKAAPTTAPPDPTDIQGRVKPDDRPDLPPGALKVTVHGGSQADEPLMGVKIRMVKGPNAEPITDEVMTSGSGTADLKADVQEPIVAVFTINGKEMSSQPLDLTKNGMALDVTVRWPSQGKPEVAFDLVPRQGQVVYAETSLHGQVYRTLPFQPVPERGTRVTLLVFPRLLFKFSWTSHADDEYLAVQGRFTLTNYSYMPYVGGPDGLVVPLPKGFVGGILAPEDQGDIAVAPGEGFRIVRPLPPGQRSFVGGFSLPVSHGEVSWNLDLPFGALDSGMEIRQTPGMQVQTPPGANGQTVTVPQGTYFVLSPISIMPKQSMVMTISGLPSLPGWRVWLPRIIGGVVVIVMIGGVTIAIRRKNPDTASTADRDARRQKLLDELVELEKAGKDGKRRDQVMRELEKLWDDGAA